jgi:hypothetical protein
VVNKHSVGRKCALLGFSSINPTYKQALSLYFKELNVFSVKRSASVSLGGGFLLTFHLICWLKNQTIKP